MFLSSELVVTRTKLASEVYHPSPACVLYWWQQVSRKAEQGLQKPLVPLDLVCPLLSVLLLSHSKDELLPWSGGRGLLLKLLVFVTSHSAGCTGIMCCTS